MHIISNTQCVSRNPRNLHSREISVFARSGGKGVAAETYRSRSSRDYVYGNSCRKHERHSGKSVFTTPPPLLPVSPFRPLSQTALPFSREGEPRKFVAHDVSARRNENATAKLPISSPQIFLAAPASFRSPPPPLVFPTVWKDREDPIDSSFSPVCSLFSSHNEEKLESARSPDIIEL